jgi:TRAP-type C4-dicarboxylate transport system substrate-binding protein
VILLAYPVIANAQSWSELSDEQRTVLAPLEEDWSSLTPPRQKKWVEVANRYPDMSETEQNILQSRMNQWADLSTKQRQRARDNYLRTLKISPEQKAAAWESYQQLSDEEKKLLAQKRAQTSKPTTVTSPTLK